MPLRFTDAELGVYAVAASAGQMATLLGSASLIRGLTGRAGDRIDLKVLVLTDGSSPVEAIRTELDTEGVPYTSIDLTNPSRQQLTAAYLAGSVVPGW